MELQTVPLNFTFLHILCVLSQPYPLCLNQLSISSISRGPARVFGELITAPISDIKIGEHYLCDQTEDSVRRLGDLTAIAAIS